MLQKTIKFKDLDGNDVEEVFYFNLTKAEVVEFELSKKDGIKAYMEKLIVTRDGGEIIATVKQLISMAVGKRSEDGRRFMKSPEITNEFLMSDAYSEFFMELVTDASKTAEFMKAIVPQDMAEAIEKGQKVSDLELPPEEQPAWIRENRDPTPIELRDMSAEQMREAFQRKTAAGVELPPSV